MQTRTIQINSVIEYYRSLVAVHSNPVIHADELHKQAADLWPSLSMRQN